MSQKKQVLCINYSLHSGGIETSLVTLLSLFDFTRSDVDLQLFANEGLFLDRGPPQVNPLPPLFPAEYKLKIRIPFTFQNRRFHPLSSGFTGQNTDFFTVIACVAAEFFDFPLALDISAGAANNVCHTYVLLYRCG